MQYASIHSKLTRNVKKQENKTYNTEGKKIQWVETDQETTQMIELVSRSIKSYNYIPYVQEAREKTEYVK